MAVLEKKQIEKGKKQEDSAKDLRKIIKELEEKIKEKDIIIQNITKSIPEIRFWKLFNPKKYEEALKSSYDMLEVVMDNIPDNIFWKDRNLVYLGCNENYVKLIGADNIENVIGSSDVELITDMEKVEYLQERELNIMNSDEAEYHIIEKWNQEDGTKLWLDTNRIPLHDSQGKSVGILVTYDDITIKVIAKQKLIESEEKFRTIAEQSQMGIAIVQDGYFKYINKAVSKITEYPINQMLNSPLRNLKVLVHPEDLNIAVDLINKKTSESEILHLRLITKYQKQKWIEVYLKTINYQEKSAQLIILYDITQKREAERLIIKENMKLSELDQIRRELITRISHELKTPLISVYTGSEMLLDFFRDQISDEILEIIEIIYRGGNQLKNLIETLLDVSKIESDKMPLKKNNVNLTVLINESIKDVLIMAKNRNISIQSDLSEEIYLKCDNIRIKQVFTNILSNAVKNTPSNGQIFINLKENKHYFDFNIKDTGVGLTKKEIEKLFKKFGKIERYGKDMDVEIGGTGLGLYISKEILELHGGQIFVESEGRNKGSTFTIRLFK